MNRIRDIVRVPDSEVNLNFNSMILVSSLLRLMSDVANGALFIFVFALSNY